LPAGWYGDPARATLESTACFLRQWQFVCHAADLPSPGTAARVDCVGQTAFVLRGRDGTLRAFRNACRHRGARLVDGDPDTGLAFCVDARVRCPYHGWTYDDDGRLVGIPTTQDFAGCDQASLALHAIAVTQWRGLVFAAFERPAETLAQRLDAHLPDWPDLSAWRRLGAPRTTHVEADWKLACEHLLEAAHFSVARPALKPRVFGPPAYTPRGPHAAHTHLDHSTGEAPTWSARSYQALLPVDAPRAACALFVWPNVRFVLASDGLGVVQVLPGTAAGTCTLREVRFGPPDGTRATRLLRYAHERVIREARRVDRRLLERTQHGLASLPRTEAPPIDSNETGLRWFAERYVTETTIAPDAAQRTTQPRRPRTPRKSTVATTAGA
jgi:phenylpropionate dioxygenase-like ring-hydroxylating dioxygenase large terminal subunit